MHRLSETCIILVQSKMINTKELKDMDRSACVRRESSVKKTKSGKKILGAETGLHSVYGHFLTLPLRQDLAT